jgi:dipeptidyl-peptidase III
MSARAKEYIEFISSEDQELYDQNEGAAYEVQVGIHELLGHGTGKLFSENEKGEKNFPADFVHPFKGNSLDTFYRAGETWDSKVSSICLFLYILIDVCYYNYIILI